MSIPDSQTPIGEDANAQPQQALIVEYLQHRGHTFETLHTLPEQEAKRLITQASIYASITLAEVETRAQIIHEVHGTVLSLD